MEMSTTKNGGAAMDSNRIDEIDEIDGKTKKMAKTYSYQIDESEDKNIWCRFNFKKMELLRFNPVVSFFSLLLIVSFAAICIVYGEKVPFFDWKDWIVRNFTWLYIGSQDIWAVFAIILYFSKYADIKLGKDDDKPDYNDVTWFMMLFACGIGTGLFFYGVAEPIFHYVGPNRYTADPTLPDNTLAQIAMNLTLYHWGIHGWIVYSLVGMLLAMMAYRENLPMTMKSCFYPLIGDRIYGWMGDLIDTISVMTTLFGVCTSLGLGTRQLNTGVSIINPEIGSDSLTIQLVIIWCITFIATISTVSGVGMGIRRLSESCFLLGMFLMVIALFMGETFYILNFFVQSIGYYVQHIIQLGFHCDTFEMVNPPAGSADRGRFTPEGFEKSADDYKTLGLWMNDWTMFYWGWWISWCPFVGMFIAKISRGRTIRNFINGTLTAPIIYSFMWMLIFGGEGLRIERQAAGEGYCCAYKGDSPFHNASMIKNMTEIRISNFSTPLTASSSDFLCTGSQCSPCQKSYLQKVESENMTYQNFVDLAAFLGDKLGSVSPDRKLSRLSCHKTPEMWFDVMNSFGDMGFAFTIISLIGIILYFVTSSDSGSLVIDCLTANGDPEPPRIQRVFWALMEGATASALLYTGHGVTDKKSPLQALQTAGLVSGLPYTIIVCLICVAIWRYVKMVLGDMDPNGPVFKIGLFDCFFVRPIKSYNKKHFIEDGIYFLKWLLEIIRAPWTLGSCAARVYGSKSASGYRFVSIAFVFLWILFLILQLTFDGAWSIAWWWYLCFTTLMTAVRLKTREIEDIYGNPAEDFFSSLFFYPNVALQLRLTLLECDHEEDNSVQGGQTSIDMDNIGKSNPTFVKE